MSNTRAPKSKEEYTSPSDIEVIRDSILEKGKLLETMRAGRKNLIIVCQMYLLFAVSH